MDDVLNTLLDVRVKRHEGSYSLNKPLMLLAALGRCGQGKDRLTAFHVYEDALLSISHKFGNLNAVFPFGRLPTDGVWEIPRDSELYRNSSGDLLRSELIDKGILGGFPVEIYSTLTNNPELFQIVVTTFLEQYIPQEKHAAVISAFNLSLLNDSSNDQAGDIFVSDQNNGFISYLNSLHNLGASGANALAESQALNSYFGELYESFPLVDQLEEILKDSVERVVVLTGHAGDGKSTVALDVFKRLRGLSATAPLDQPLKEREDINAANGSITVVKDMSELSARRRKEWLDQAFSKSGSWLIVSNTGPLLNSLVDYANGIGFERNIESPILERLDEPFHEDSLDGHGLDGFAKELVILNLTRLDNVALGAKILTKLVNHSAWAQCKDCSIESACPLQLNRKGLYEAGAVPEKRVRWIYRRLSAYEQRLTLRQIVAQLAFGLTGGMSCDEARQQVNSSAAEGPDRGTGGLARILFSESFFGYRAGEPWPQAERLQAIALIRRTTYGGPVGVNFERNLSSEAGMGWAVLPSSLDQLDSRWRRHATESAAVRWRFALRRMAYMFGKTMPGKEQSANVFLDTFLQSPSLRKFDFWQEIVDVYDSDIESLLISCLRVLLEVFSGFSASQFHSELDNLYLTVRRPDKAVVQPTQLVVETLSFQNFDLIFDPVRRVPLLSYDSGRIELALPLPLLDYIRRRDAGELSSVSSPIYQAQLNWFGAELLRVATKKSRRSNGKIELLRAGIDGEVKLHRFVLNRDQKILKRARL